MIGFLRRAARLINFPKGMRYGPPDPKWVIVQKKISASSRVIDLGCGNNPIWNAEVGVDLYLEPKQRALGAGPAIDPGQIEKQGCIFINAAIDQKLPFRDKEFDFAYSHHAFEHLEDPAAACREMMRIAQAGAIITPSILAELIFGKSYHKWLVMERNSTLLFFKKRPFEDRPFGEHPEWDTRQNKWKANNNTNPFDILLNDGCWYRGRREFPRLAGLLQKYYYAHSPLMEVIFLWEGSFRFTIYE